MAERVAGYEPWKSIAASALLQEAVRPNVILGWTPSKGTARGSTWVNDGSEVEKKWLHRVVLVLEKGGSLRPWRGTLVSSYARALLHSTKYTVQVINQVRQDAQDRVWFTFVGSGRLVSSQRVILAYPHNVFHRSFVCTLQPIMREVAHTMDVVEETRETLSPIYKAGLAWLRQARASSGGSWDEAVEECYDVFAYRAYKMRRARR